MILIQKTIQSQEVILKVDEKIPSNKLGGLPILTIGKEIAVIYPVDTLTVIKGIANAKTLQDLADSVQGTWAEEQVEEIVGGMK